MSTTDCTVHFHAGTNDPGYLPDSEPDSFTTWEDAQRYIIGEMLSDADSVASWTEPHDCDDIPCPVFGDDCPEGKASALTFEAEELNLCNGPEYSAVTSGRSYWIVQCSEPGCDSNDYEPESDEPPFAADDARRIAVDWHSGQASPLYAFSSSGHVSTDLAAEVRQCVAETKVHPAHYTDTDRRELRELLQYVASVEPEPDDEPESECVSAPDVWQLLEQSAPEGCEAVQDLYSWSLNYDAGKGPFGLFLDLTGWSEDNYGSDVYDFAARNLGYVELSKLAAALEEYSTLPASVHEYVSVLLEAATA